MRLYRDTSVVSLDEVESDGVDLSAIRSIHHESFSLPIEDRIQLELALESLTELQQRVVYLFSEGGLPLLLHGPHADRDRTPARSLPTKGLAPRRVIVKDAQGRLRRPWR